MRRPQGAPEAAGAVRALRNTVIAVLLLAGVAVGMFGMTEDVAGALGPTMFFGLCALNGAICGALLFDRDLKDRAVGAGWGGLAGLFFFGLAPILGFLG